MTWPSKVGVGGADVVVVAKVMVELLMAAIAERVAAVDGVMTRSATTRSATTRSATTTGIVVVELRLRTEATLLARVATRPRVATRNPAVVVGVGVAVVAGAEVARVVASSPRASNPTASSNRPTASNPAASARKSPRSNRRSRPPRHP